MMVLECIKGYSTDENVVFLNGDTVIINEMEEGIVYLEGLSGWCKGIEISISPKIVAECFRYSSLLNSK